MTATTASKPHPIPVANAAITATATTIPTMTPTIAPKTLQKERPLGSMLLTGSPAT